jgi:hypothetical protein
MPDRQVESTADQLEAVVLEVMLDDNPALMSIEEVVREVVNDPANLEDSDDVRNAIRELIRSGLLHRSGEFVFATRAAVRAAELGI